jgi:pimeloyl-ACP methyl ester carboxylesterase
VPATRAASGRCHTAVVAATYRSRGHAEQVREWCRGALREWLLPHQMHDVQTSLGRTQVVEAGVGEDVCVYLPGTNFNAASSTVVLGALANRFLVYAADIPGQPGLSADLRPRDEVAGYAWWLSELLAWVRTKRPTARIVLAGHSRGAAVALSADPDTVHGLALLSPAGLVAVRPTLPMLRATLPWLLRRDEPGARRLLQFMSGPGHDPSVGLVEWMAVVARTCRTTGAPGPYPDDVVTSWRRRNVVVVVGDHDGFFPVDRLRDCCVAKLGSGPIVIEHAGHLLPEEEPTRVVDLVAKLV